MKKILVFIWEIAKIIIISLAIIIPVRYFLIQPFFVRGASMEPSFEDSDYLVIDEISYRFDNPKRGEVIVFHPPHALSQFFLKRIIGLPGEEVFIKDGGVIIKNKEFLDGKILDESSYLEPGLLTSGNLDVKLGVNEYFVMGDNRLHSSDSRSWGPVSRDLFIGRVLLRAFPFNKLDILESPSY